MNHIETIVAEAVSLKLKHDGVPTGSVYVVNAATDEEIESFSKVGRGSAQKRAKQYAEGYIDAANEFRGTDTPRSAEQ